jgi:hypothetical protein
MLVENGLICCVGQWWKVALLKVYIRVWSKLRRWCFHCILCNYHRNCDTEQNKCLSHEMWISFLLTLVGNILLSEQYFESCSPDVLRRGGGGSCVTPNNPCAAGSPPILCVVPRLQRSSAHSQMFSSPPPPRNSHPASKLSCGNEVW